jgi:hypothetical protein
MAYELNLDSNLNLLGSLSDPDPDGNMTASVNVDSPGRFFRLVVAD